jgi:hypothetical protein
MGACGGGSGETATTSAALTSTTPAVATTSTTRVADGRVPVYIKTVDVAQRLLTYDQIQFLTGAAAKQAWVKDHPDDPDGPPNDYYILNVNPQLYTVPIASSVVITVNIVGDGSSTDHPASLAQLADDMHKDGAEMLPFWVTISGGSIVKIEEQFVP